MSASSWGCEIIDAWLAGTIRTVAPISDAQQLASADRAFAKGFPVHQLHV